MQYYVRNLLQRKSPHKNRRHFTLNWRSGKLWDWLKKGMDLAVLEINSDSSNAAIQIIYEDDKATPNSGISAYNKLKSIDKVNYIIGGMFSNVALSIAPIAEKDDLVLMSPTASAVEFSKFGDHVFRIYPSDSYDGDFLADFSYNRLGARVSQSFLVDAASTVEISQVFGDKFKSLGGTISFTNNYKQGETNFRTILQKLRSDSSDIVFLPGYIDDISTLLKQSTELGLQKTYVSISTVYDKKLIEIAGKAAEGLIFSAPVFDANSKNAVTQNFVTLFKKENNSTPDILAAYGYDVVKISYKVIYNTQNRSVPEIIANLNNTKDYPGVTGNTNFDQNGDVRKELNILTVKNGEFVKY
ncbi:MAG: ABC transporter substrate-binding protein [Bacteroidetes bacterium]|nr:ABC transporter substrate-binding protein [Bacteroidota bacterium]